MTRVAAANALVLLGSAALLGGALAFQHLGGLAPCEMCFWQRWPHLAAIGLGLAALPAAGARRALVALAGVAVVVAAALGLFHAGVEQRWWQGPTTCSAPPATGASAQDILAEVMAAPLVRCDAIPWELFGLSLAGWNAPLSALIGGTVLWLTSRR